MARRTLTLALLLCAACAGPSTPPPAPAPADWSDALAQTERLDGLLSLHLNRDAGRVLLELPPAAEPGGELFRCLWVEGLRTGLGSNPVGLDRGQWGQARLVSFRRFGQRVLLLQPNLRHGQARGAPDEQLAARESFAESVLFAADVLASDPARGCLIDLTPFLVRDAHDVVGALRRAGQGSFRLDSGRSLVLPDAALAFVDNLEFEALLTFAGEQPGGLVRSVAPDPGALSVTLHHSFVRLPDLDYTPREADPRAGSFGRTLRDVSAPLDAPVERRLAARHRLTRSDPDDPRSPCAEPIVYYVDRGAPEPVRSALLEGAGWWAEAFAAAGWPDAFRVELLPEGVHPLDVRYHVIEWVHRATRGWSYGHTIEDPRTGEIIKGHVSLGSLRVRHDRLLFEGLLGTVATGSGAADDPVQLSLQRIRQLAAHEVGHTLGLAHAYAASITPNGSVMDYPAPHIGLDDDGELDLDAVYGEGLGAWDLVAIAWLYSEFEPPASAERPAQDERSAAPEGQHHAAPRTDSSARATERAQLDAILERGLTTAPPFLTDQDARSPSSAHPLASLWDNGADPVAALQTALAVRNLGLSRFGQDRVAPGRPRAELAEVFAPLWMHHRYQLQAALKVLGGVDYQHGLSGDATPPPRPADGEWQRRALTVVLTLLQPAALDVPDNARAVLVPPAPGVPRTAEALPGRAGPVFDPLEAAALVADQAVAGLLQPARCTRLVIQHAADPRLPGLGEVLTALLDAAVRESDSPRAAALLDQVEAVLLRRLAALASSTAASAPVRAQAEAALGQLATRLSSARSPARAAARAHLVREIERLLQRPAPAQEPGVPARPPPPGSPIGSEPREFCGWQPVAAVGSGRAGQRPAHRSTPAGRSRASASLTASSPTASSRAS